MSALTSQPPGQHQSAPGEWLVGNWLLMCPGRPWSTLLRAYWMEVMQAVLSSLTAGCWRLEETFLLGRVGRTFRDRSLSSLKCTWELQKRMMLNLPMRLLLRRWGKETVVESRIILFYYMFVFLLFSCSVISIHTMFLRFHKFIKSSSMWISFSLKSKLSHERIAF